MTSSALPLPDDEAAPRVTPSNLRALAGRAGHTERTGVALESLADDQLLALSRDGDREAFGVLVARHHRMLAGLIHQRLGPRGPVEDLLQDVFAKALSGLSQFGGRSSFATWAGAIALNLATDWGRKDVRRRRLAPPAGVAPDGVSAPHSDRALRAVETREEADRARAALDDLPLPLRAAVTLRIVEELPYETVADRLGAPVSTVRTWVSRGLRRLRERLEVHDDDT